MLNIQRGRSGSNCQGTTRRTALKAGFLGCTGITLADQLALQARGAVNRSKSVILIWLDGGPSQLETYDPKPDAPVEYRGPFGAISTNVPGIHLSETLPLHAKHADKMAFIRSLHHDNGDHFAAAHWMLTGRFGSTSVNKAQVHPSVGAYVAKLQGAKEPGMPAFVGVPAAESVYLYPGYQGGAYLGGSYDPFQVNMKQKYLAATYKSEIKAPEWLTSIDESALSRTHGRMELLGQLDQIRRQVDHTGSMEVMDEYQQQAVDMLLNGKARLAFDMDAESDKDRDRYGRGPWGHYTLMARRLVEHGVSFVTVDMPHWDNHSKIEEGHGSKLVHVDRAVAALIEDLVDRGMLDDVMVVVMGEFGRTPRLNSGQPGIPIPGRDHWGNAISAMVAGGGVQGGQVVGATNDKAEHPIARPLTPGDLLASIYHALGIDGKQAFPDHAGRPVPVANGTPIHELF
ncbi:MAG: DUF1501 domain-containing protein [Planctomycetales bacterium]|nr:DUF1501 domain-containing protein [Planctomycetales bacterium]